MARVGGRRDLPEFLDDPPRVVGDIPRNLRDIRRLNRWFGGTRAALSALCSVIPGAPCTLLDVATGSGDIPLAVHRWAARTDQSISIVASDVSPHILKEAEAVLARTPVTVERADARRLPFPDGSMDIVMCNLAIHHFGPEEAVAVLHEMWRVARVAVVVTDLTRGRTAYAATWLVTRVAARNRLTRHDGPVSVLRAYTPGEMAGLAHEAGLERVDVRRRFPFRQILVARK